MQPLNQKPGKKSKKQRAMDKSIAFVIKKIEFLMCYVNSVFFSDVEKEAEGIDKIRTFDNKKFLSKLLSAEI